MKCYHETLTTEPNTVCYFERKNGAEFKNMDFGPHFEGLNLSSVAV